MGWHTVKRVFQDALDQAPEARAAFLEKACGGDAILRDEVESLLASHDSAGGPVQTGGAARLVEPSEIAAEAMLGRRVGPYRILRAIGRGGMGAVYLACRDDREYDKQVAIKLVRGWPDAGIIVERFRHERQILAGLEHPNIARLLDGGTTEEGLPYLVMEYIEGVSIDAYCDARKLSIAERLELFRTVCSAVHHAHEKRIVHRDIKPANILISGDGVPKLLDFGIAKLLAADAVHRGPITAGFPMMTPEYASPEQVRGGTIGPASDVYSLGVLLHWLLSGQGPYRLATNSAVEVIEAVLHQEPETPSAASARGEDRRLARRLRGDLDSIVLRALRKDPRERYPSAEELSADIGRYLNAEPVAARKGTTAYRAGKFLRRQKAGLATAAVVLVSLAAGIVSTGREHARAERLHAQLNPAPEHLYIGVHPTLSQPAEGIRLVVTEFANETGDKSLDGAAAMLKRSLGRSRLLSVVRSPGQARALVAGTLRRSGEVYTVDLKLLDPFTREPLMTAREQGRGKESVPRSIDRLSEQVRDQLTAP